MSKEGKVNRLISHATRGIQASSLTKAHFTGQFNFHSIRKLRSERILLACSYGFLLLQKVLKSICFINLFNIKVDNDCNLFCDLVYVKRGSFPKIGEQTK